MNQFQEAYSVDELAEKVANVGSELGLDVEIRHIENPRQELEEHYYSPDHQKLLDLGYQPTTDVEGEMRSMITDLIEYRYRIEEKRDLLIPDIRWDGSRKRSAYIAENG